MKHAHIVAIALLVGVAVAVAAPPQQRTFVTPSFQGHVYRMEAPAGWTVTFANDYGFELSSQSDLRRAGIRIALSVAPIPKMHLVKHGWKPDGSALPGEVLASYVKGIRRWKDQKTFERSVGRLAGHSALCRAIGPGTLYDPTKKTPVPTEGAIQKTYHVMTTDYTHISASLRTNRVLHESQGVFRRLLPVAEKVVASIREIDLSAMSEQEKARILTRKYASPQVVISRRRDYYVKMQVEMLCPPGWQAKVTTSRAAGPSSEKGLCVIEVTMPFEVKKDQAVARLMIVMEGLPVGPLDKGDFLKTLDPRVNALLPEPKLLSTKEIRFPATEHLARTRGRRTTPTGKTVVRTYSGQDAYGRTLKVRAHTAGGLTVACHIILVTDADSYEKILPQVDNALGVLRINLQLPSVPSGL